MFLKDHIFFSMFDLSYMFLYMLEMTLLLNFSYQTLNLLHLGIFTQKMYFKITLSMKYGNLNTQVCCVNMII